MFNIIRKYRLKAKITGLIASSIFLNAQTAYAAPGKLADAPLFLSTAVEPNIFLIHDDSGSMLWEQIYQDGIGGFAANEGLPTLYTKTLRDGSIYTREAIYWNPKWLVVDGNGDINAELTRELVPPAGYQHSNTSVTWDESLWLLRNHNANKLYYNPDIEYKPWPGLDSSGNPLYKPADPEAVLHDPTKPDGKSANLKESFDYIDYDDCRKTNGCKKEKAYFIPSYYAWTDTDGDGIIEATDAHTLIKIDSEKSYPSGRSYVAELKNFANWFQYYRKREYAAKAAIGSVINNTHTARMGLDALNHGHQIDVKTMGLTTNKTELLEAFYKINSNGHTPLRRALERVGKRFLRTESPAPILPADEGGTCQQNFAILMTDGFYNGGHPDRKIIGNNDKDDSNVTNNGFDGDPNESIDGGNYEDEYAEMLADVAMHFYETDLREDLDDKVPTKTGVDLANHQHLVTYTVSFGLKGSLDPSKDDPLAEGFKWPAPSWATGGKKINKVDDLWHAAYNARGKYLSAHNPEELRKALNEAVEDIANRTSRSASASVTSAQLSTSSKVFLSRFNSAPWKGNVFAYGIVETKASSKSDKSVTITSLTDEPLWDAAEKLDQQADPVSSRIILTMKGDGVAFKWDKLSEAMQADLYTNPDGSKGTEETAMARLAYLRGDRSKEGTDFRQRASLLGDIIHSAPAYVAQSNLPWPDSAPFPNGASAYSKYKLQTPSQKGVIYVGANDGMLHAFDAEDGKEIMAYIPSYLASTESGKGLHYLTDPNYTHRYYNDQSPMITDAYLGSVWRTILVSGQGAGGRGYFALDITSPEYFTEERAPKIVLWEFDYNDDADLGYTFSRPQVGMTNDGKFSVVFGNGYNDSGDGEAKLFILDIKAGADGNWSTSDYREISTGVGSEENRNGLSSPQLIDLDGNGTADRAYAGDLFGNMWAFDLSDSKKANWNTAYGTKPLFTTADNRPITTKPAISLHPTIDSIDDNYPNLMITFGSGQYLTLEDRSSTYKNNFYGVWDRGTSGLKPANLMKQPYRAGYTRLLAQDKVDYIKEQEYGWYIELDDSGERSITDSLIRSGIVFFNTNVPSADECSNGGYGYRFIVDLKNGGTPSNPVIDINGDGDVDKHDVLIDEDGDPYLAYPMKVDDFLNRDTLTEKHLISGEGLGGSDPILTEEQPPRQKGRISWQELLRND